MARRQDLDRIRRLRDRLGPMVLVVTRGVPVLAEASVLWMGMHGLPWRRFWGPVLLSNLGLSLAYSCFGAWAESHGWLPLALGFSIALPVLLATILGRTFRAETAAPPEDPPA
jgi:membrane protein DedA with SNARE-associated domain